MTALPPDPALDSSYETCRRMQRRHDPTYYVATRRLPADIRPATHALYGYVRTAGALVDAGRRHRLPLGELGTYMRSMRIDCAPVRIETWPELEAYMDGSAGSVGRIMAPLLGVPARHHAGFGRLGQAFQLTNFIRDVREDTRLDRVYLPAEDRAGFGVGEEDLGAEHASAELRALLALEVRRARGLFAEAEPAMASAPGSVRTGIRFAVAVYQRVLDRVERIEFDVLGRPTGVR